MEATTTKKPASQLQEILFHTELFSEAARFKKLQEGFPAQFESVFPDRKAGKTVVIIPSMTLDPEILSKIEGINHYEERLLCLLMLLRMPNTQVVFVTSMPVDPAIVDYYLHLLPGITSYHARQRLTLLSCYDASPLPLTQKILDRPRLRQRILQSIPFDHQSHLTCFNVTEAERNLAVELGLPIYGCDPDLSFLGNKSNSRRIFRTCGLPLPDGFEDLYSMDDVVQALEVLKTKHPSLKKAVVKLNSGFSGDGNAIFTYEEAPADGMHPSTMRQPFSSRLKVVASDLSFEAFMKKMQEEGGVVEAFIDGIGKASPSVQCRITPLGKIEVISTHDQLLAGEFGQVYTGATFPASAAYAPLISSMGSRVAEELKSYGVLGRFSIDFITIKEEGVWKAYAIEINLRKGGTTHPYLMLQFLTDGCYHPEEALYYTAAGQPRYYICTDNLCSPHFKGLTPHDLIDIAMCHDLLYDGSLQEGTVFHLIGALSQYGKLGLVCIGSTPQRALYFYEKTREVLYREGRGY